MLTYPHWNPIFFFPLFYVAHFINNATAKVGHAPLALVGKLVLSADDLCKEQELDQNCIIFMRGSRKFCQRGSKFNNIYFLFFKLMRGL